MIEIREARPEDASEICQIQRATWIQAYVSQEYEVTRKDLEEYTKKWTSPENVEDFSKLIASQTENDFWLVAECDGRIVGHIKSGKLREVVFIHMLYVLKEYQGKKVGTDLMLKTINRFGDSKFVVDV
ncbi:MAG: GNAT family N-acetyltransferase, partial [Candidatus Saccharibacteria bacterium]|nr:GNAT family N-acetyltransferase [Candidatus Saccharibacteria bacterium]